jgi:glycosyltransferase involved in cell wall biosynthesis
MRPIFLNSLADEIRDNILMKVFKRFLKRSVYFIWARNAVRMITARRLRSAPLLLQSAKISTNPVLIVLDHGFLGGQSGSQRVVEAQIRYFKNLGKSVHGCFVYPAQINHRLPGVSGVASAMGFDAAFEIGVDFTVRNLGKLRNCLCPSTIPGRRISLAEQLYYSELIELPIKVTEQVNERPYDVVLCNYVWNIPISLKLAGSAPVVVETHDIQSRQLAFATNRSPLVSEMDLEVAQLGRCKTIIALNSEEYAYFDQRCVNSDVKLVFPSIPSKKLGSTNSTKTYDVLFVGSRHRPNFEGLMWFLKNVKPSLPNVRVCVAGSVGEIFVERHLEHLLNSDGVTYLGVVEDLDHVYAQSSIAIVPVHDGEGISIKTIEAMAYGIPVVSTSVGLRGFPDDHGLMAFDTPEMFATAIRELLKNSETHIASASHSSTIFSRYFSAEANELGYQAAIGFSESNVHAN